MKKKIINKLKGALYGIDISDSFPDKTDFILYRKNITPPSYMIKLIFHMLSELEQLPEGEEKSEWQIPITYDSKNWIISDLRRSSWEIYGPSENENTVKELEKKLSSATTVLNNHINELSQDQVEKDKIFLQNYYPKIYLIYKTFVTQLALIINEEFEQTDNSSSSDSNLADLLNFKANRLHRIESNLISAVVFFFSLTEAIMDSCFSLGDRKGKTFIEFRNLKWNERFKFFIQPNSDNKVNELFSELLIIRQYYRHAPVHSIPQFFVNIENIGLVPRSYESLYQPHMSEWWSFDEDEVMRILSIFDDTLKLFKEHQNTMYGYLYAKSGHPIYIDPERVEMLKQYITSEEDFKNQLNRMSEMQCAYDNMEI